MNNGRYVKVPSEAISSIAITLVHCQNGNIMTSQEGLRMKVKLYNKGSIDRTNVLVG